MPEDKRKRGRAIGSVPWLAWFARHAALFAYCVLAAGLLLWVSWDAFYVRLVSFGSTADYWEHSATLRALLDNPFRPGNPHLASSDSSPRFIPSFLLAALITRAFGGDALFAMGVASSLHTLLLCVGIYAFFRAYFASRLAPIYGLLVMFMSAREAFHYSNVYQLKIFFSVAAYPSTLALGLVLLGFAWEVRLLRSSSPRLPWELLGFASYQALILITHPLTAMMSFAGVPILALTWRATTQAGWRSWLGELRASDWRRRAWLMGTAPASLLIAQLWPYFSVWEVLRGGKHGNDPAWVEEALSTAMKGDFGNTHAFYRWPELFDTLYLALLAVPVLLFLLARARHLFLVLGALAMLTPFVVNAYVPLPLGHRFILLAVFFMHAALVWLLLALTRGTPEAAGFLRKPALAWIGLSSVVLFLAYAVDLNVSKAQARFEANARRYKDGQSPVVRYSRRVAELTDKAAVILGPADATWPLPTFGPKVVSLLHENPLVPDAQRRIYDVRRFLDGRVDDAERLEIVRRYGVTHVVVKGNPGGRLAEFLQVNAHRTVLPTGKSLFKLAIAGGP